MKVTVTIPIPELELAFAREMDLFLVFVGHQIALSGLGCLIINETMESHFDENGKSSELTVFVLMDAQIKEYILSEGREEAINVFAAYKFFA